MSVAARYAGANRAVPAPSTDLYTTRLFEDGENHAAYNIRVLTRDLRALADTHFDLLIIGAGIYGAAIAWTPPSAACRSR